MGGSKSKLSKAEIKKLEANTKFTKAEILRWYKGFIQVRHELMPDSIAISMLFFLVSNNRSLFLYLSFCNKQGLQP